MKSGFVSVVGRTNAGKSSLINYLLGTKITMVSHKQNATRRKINAIVMNGDDQVIFIDTPGFTSKQKTLNKLMNESAVNSLNDCDFALFTASIFDDLSEYEKFLQRQIPHLIAITKIDLAKDEQIFKKLSEYQKYAEFFKAIIPVSIKKGAYRKILLDEICKYLPEHEYFYDPEFLTSTNEKEIYRDFILEAIFQSVSDEVPYYSDVIIKKVTQKPNITEIIADIITDNEHHKKILITAIKRIGINARKLICFLNKNKTHLNLKVIIKKDTFKNEKHIAKLIQ